MRTIALPVAATRRGSLVFLLALSVAHLAPAWSRAATCYVDPTGGSPYVGAYASVNLAIAAGCNTPGTVIDIWCPALGCIDRDVVVSGLADVTIRSLEATTAGGGPVQFISTVPGAALRIESSTKIGVVGIDSMQSGVEVVEVLDSTATFEGLTAITPARYTQITGHEGMRVGGASLVTLRGVGFHANAVGLRMTALASGKPRVVASAVAFLDNGRAVDVTGTASPCGALPETQLVLLSDFSLVWQNYVMGNVEGIHLHGHSAALVDHTIFASNLTQMAPGGANPHVIGVFDSSSFLGRNLLVYDNDQLPGLTQAWAGGIPAGIGSILEHASCGSSTFQASTIANNGSDLVLSVGGSGQVNLDHTVVVGNWGKTLSMSGYYVANGNTCPPLGMSAAYFWNDRILADPAVCLPPPPGLRSTWNPVPIVSATTPRTLAAYPQIPPVWTDLYLIKLKQPLATPLPVDLYMVRPWSVNGKRDDKRRLDVGYHNPK